MQGYTNRSSKMERFVAKVCVAIMVIIMPSVSIVYCFCLRPLNGKTSTPPCPRCCHDVMPLIVDFVLYLVVLNVCVGHDIDLAGESPVAGAAAKRRELQSVGRKVRVKERSLDTLQTEKEGDVMDLIEMIPSEANMCKTIERVEWNNEASGVGGMPVDGLGHQYATGYTGQVP